jgi:hypothetical protein
MRVHEKVDGALNGLLETRLFCRQPVLAGRQKRDRVRAIFLSDAAASQSGINLLRRYCDTWNERSRLVPHRSSEAALDLLRS